MEKIDKNLEELFLEIERANNEIALAMANRDVATIKAVRGWFEDYPHFSKAYRDWQK